MKPETLEALLLDRAMGELSPEVAELLDAHLASTPDAARQAGGFAAVIQQARQAVAVAEPPPPLAISRLQQAQVAWRRRAIIWKTARLAACVILGLTLGWYVRSTRVPPVVAATPASSAVSAPVPPRGSKSTQDFWSLARLEAVQQEHQLAESRATSRYRLRWDSPVKMPHLEDDL
jgi:hypothetical protein